MAVSPPVQPDPSTMPNPGKIMGTLTAFVDAAALKAAIELDLFTAIAEGTDTAPALAEKREASERGVRILCDFLTVTGFLTKEHGRYGLSPEAGAFLNKQSPAYMGAISGFLASDHVISEFSDLARVIREGKPLDKGAGLEPNHHMWVDFARSMAPMMMMPAQKLADILLDGSQEPLKVLDIAAGHGIYGLVMAQRNPNAEVVGVDWPNVLELAKENAGRFGVADRYKTIAGSAFDVDFGTGYDLVLLPNFLHHFDAGTNEGLLRKVKAALSPSGRVAIVEFVPNDDRVSPPMPASFAMMMLGGTTHGDAYTERELRQMLTNAGFGSVERHELLPSPQTLLVASV